MARKTTVSSATTRKKKTAAPTQPAAAQVAPEVPKNGKSANAAPGNLVPSNLEEEIRRRAYELYLQRQAAAGDQSGDENQDWLIAEREIRSRHGTLARHTTA